VVLEGCLHQEVLEAHRFTLLLVVQDIP
jgi:hypothetical protein